MGVSHDSIKPIDIAKLVHVKVYINLGAKFPMVRFYDDANTSSKVMDIPWEPWEPWYPWEAVVKE